MGVSTPGGNYSQIPQTYWFFQPRCTAWTVLYRANLRRTLLMFEGGSMLWTVFVLLLILWLLGFSFHIAGGLIHLLLVVALVVLVINLLTGRRAAV